MTPPRRRVPGRTLFAVPALACVLLVATAGAASAAGPTDTGAAAPGAAPMTGGGVPVAIVVWAALGLLAGFVGLFLTHSRSSARHFAGEMNHNDEQRGLATARPVSAIPLLAGGER